MLIILNSKMSTKIRVIMDSMDMGSRKVRLKL
jgi:hypothetical protein